MATRIRNGYLAGKKEVEMPRTTLLVEVAEVMIKEKYLKSQETLGEYPKQTLKLTLNYAGSNPSITEIKRISKPGVRIYHSASDLKPVLSGLGISIISTSKGVMTGNEARKNKLGGEVLLELW
jgi:small subunit ribosomal protein S8